MSPKTLTRPAVHPMEVAADGVTPNSSAIVGVTLVGDMEEIIAVLRAGTLVARNLKLTLSVELPGENVFPVYVDQVSSPAALSGLLDSAKTILCKLDSSPITVFVVEVTVTAASLVAEAVIAIRIRTAHANSIESATR
jgi:hypothetical protein